MISQLEEEERELNVMMADAQRNLQQARKAVQETKKDRGWKSAKGSQPYGNQKGTSTFMHGKGPRMQNNFVQHSKGFSGKGGFAQRSPGFSNWRPQQKNRFAGRQNHPPGRSYPFSGNRPPPSHGGMYVEPQGHHMMTMTDMIPEAEFSHDQSFFPVDKADPKFHVRPEEAILDSGATVSAGGEAAVRNLIHSLAQSRPDLSVTVISEDRPYFRYG